MAQINTYRAEKGLQNPGSPSVNLDNSMAQAVKGLGGAIADVGSAAERFRNADDAAADKAKREQEAAAAKAQKRQEERSAFTAENSYKTMQMQLGADLAEQTDAVEGDAEGFHDAFLKDVFIPKRDAFLATITDPELREKYSTILGDPADGASGGSDREAWSIKAAQTERDKTYSWATNTAEQQLEQLATAISINPGEYDTLLASGNDLLKTMPVPDETKRKMLANWETMAQVSHLNTQMTKDPEGVAKSLNADFRTLSPTTQFDVLRRAVIGTESGGNPNAVSPVGAVGLMQIMPRTAEEIARELGDANFPANGGASSISRYLQDPKLNQAYGDHYLKKQLRAFGGDVEAALIAYNGGASRARAWLKAGRDDSVIPEESADYYKKVAARTRNDNVNEGARPDATFVWVRDGKNVPMTDNSPEIASTDPQLRARVATAFGAIGIKEVRIRSAERDKEHNEAVGGAPGSKHIGGGALDIDVTGLSHARRIDIIRALSANGIGGIGVYSFNTIHADLGPRRAWGNSHGSKSVPKWAAGAVAEHLANTAKTPQVAGRYSTLPYDKREQFIRQADVEITRRHNEANRASDVQKTQVRRAMDQELANITATGQGIGAVDLATIASTLGEDDAMQWDALRKKTETIYDAKLGIAAMTPDEMLAREEQYKAMPGTEGFATALEVEDAVDKEVKRVTSLRETDPEAAAREFPEVKKAYDATQEAMTAGTPVEPAAMQEYVRLNLERQADFNLSVEDREPIPRDDARAIGKNLAKLPELGKPGVKVLDVRDALVTQYKTLHQMFGEYTDDVIAYSLTQYKGVGKLTAEYVAGTMKAIAMGGDPLKLNALPKAIDMDAIESFGSMRKYSGVISAAKGEHRYWFGDGKRTDMNADATDEPPAPEGGGAPSPEVVSRVMSQLATADGPEDEVMLIRKYGQAAVTAAKAQQGR